MWHCLLRKNAILKEQHRISRNNCIIRVLHVEMVKSANNRVTFVGHKTRSLQYYIVTDRSKHIYIRLLSAGPVDGSVIVVDRDAFRELCTSFKTQCHPLIYCS